MKIYTAHEANATVKENIFKNEDIQVSIKVVSDAVDVGRMANHPPHFLPIKYYRSGIIYYIFSYIIVNITER